MIPTLPIKWLAPVLLVLLSTDARADALARVDEFVRAEMAREKVPGVAVAIVDHGAVVKAEGYGLANVEHGVPVRAGTIFQSGSLGKQFTAATVMTLVEEGRIGLDDSIAKYFPEAPEPFRAITVRHLLTHTSGIPDYTEGTIDLRRDYTEDELAKLAFGLKLEFAPGSRWNYSNTGYLMLGVLVGRLSPDEFAYVRAGFFPGAPKRYAELLRGLGEPSRLDLVERRELGDDRVYRYVVGYEGGKTLRVRLGVAPDGKVPALSIASE